MLSLKNYRPLIIIFQQIKSSSSFLSKHILLQGEFPCSAQVPITLGHEFCGTVSDVGCAVHLINKGDRVVVDPNT